MTYPSGTHVVFTAPGSATSGQYGLSEWTMSGTRGGAGPHFQQTFSESFYGFMPDGGPAQVDARGLPGQAAGRSVIEIWIAPDGRDATALSRRTGSGRTGAPVHGSTPHDRTVILRCTRKLLTVLGSAVAKPALRRPGDWYANLLRFDRRTCLLLTHSGTLFTIVEVASRHPLYVQRASWSPASSGGSCPAKSCRRGRPAIWQQEVLPARTADRSVLGGMNDMAFRCEHAIASAEGLGHADLAELNRTLRRTINSARGYCPPIELAARRLAI